MNRRGFIGSILAAGMAPAIVRADALMRVRPVDEWLWVSTESIFVFEDFDVSKYALTQNLYVSLHTANPHGELPSEASYTEYSRTLVPMGTFKLICNY